VEAENVVIEPFTNFFSAVQKVPSEMSKKQEQVLEKIRHD
jgi:hypothetical protein